MATETLRDLVVNIIAEGVEKANKSLDDVDKKAEKAERSIRSLADRFVSFGLKVGATGSAMLGIFGQKAMAGTVEAERFSLAIERFFRVTGDALAPYVRFATEAIQKLTSAFYGLSPSTKDALVKVSLAAVGVGVLAGALFSAIKVAGLFGAALAFAFSGPLGVITLLATAAVALAGVMGGVFDQGISTGERFVRVVTMIIQTWEGLKTLGGALAEIFAPALEWIISAFKKSFEWVMDLIGIQLPDSANEAVEGMSSTYSSFVEATVGMFFRIRENWSKMTAYMHQIWEAMLSTISQAYHKIVDSMAVGMAKVAELFGIVPEGTADLITKEGAEKQKQIANDLNNKLADLNEQQKKDADELKKKNEEAMDALKGKLDGARNKAREIVDPIVGMLDRLKQGGGFKLKMEMQFESLQGTFDRLQKAMGNASGSGVDIDKMMLGQLEGINDGMQKAVNKLDGINRAVPVVVQ